VSPALAAVIQASARAKIEQHGILLASVGVKDADSGIKVVASAMARGILRALQRGGQRRFTEPN
jgi:hypothetical protein